MTDRRQLEHDQMSLLIKKSDPNRLLRLSAAAKRLGGWTTKTVRKWIAQGKIDAVKMPNGHWMIKEAEIQRVVSSRNNFTPQ